MNVNYEKDEQNQLRVVKTEEKVMNYNLDDLIDQKARHEAKVAELDELIAEARKAGVKTQEEINIEEEAKKNEAEEVESEE